MSITEHSSKAVNANLRTAAWQAFEAQRALFRNLCLYLWQMKEAGSLSPLLLLQRVSYDETPLRVALTWDSSEGRGTEVGKVFCMESSWAVLVKRCEGGSEDKPDESESTKGFEVYRGHFTPQLRAADAKNGEAISMVMSTCVDLIDELPVPDLFQRYVRLVDTDSCPANERAERLWAAFRPQWSRFLVPCSAHRMHAASEKLLKMLPTWHKGVVRSLLLAQRSQNLSAMRRALMEVIREKCRLVPAHQYTLTLEARTYRKNLLSIYLPSRKTSRKRCRVLLTVAALMNGDWQSPDLLHICSGAGCCPNGLGGAKWKMEQMLAKLLTTLRPSLLTGATGSHTILR